DPGIEGVRFIPLNNRPKGTVGRLWAGTVLLCRQYDYYYWRKPLVKEALQQLAGVKVDAIIANDLDTLPLALRVAGAAKILFDAHEYAPREYEDLWHWRLLI